MTYKKTLTLIMILIFFSGLTSFFSREEKEIKPSRSFSDFPMKIGRFHGQTHKLDSKVYNILGVEDYILANYTNDTSEFINLYVGFYQSQKEGDIIHSPKNCMPGSGWNITKTSIETVPVPKLNKTIKVIKLLIVKGSQKQIVLYWFQSRGRVISSEYMQKIWLVVDSVIRHRTDGSFVRLISPVIKNQETTLSMLKDFASEVYPVLTQFIPS